MTVRNQSIRVKNTTGRSIIPVGRSRNYGRLVAIACLIATMTVLSSLQVITPLAHGEAVTATVAVGVNPSGIAVDTSTNLIYVSNYGLNGTFPSTLSVMNGSSDSVIATITVGVNPVAVDVNSVTHKAYVANYNSTNVSVISGTSNTTSTIPVETHPTGIAVNSRTNRIYVTNSGNGTVSVIDGTTNSVINTITVGRSPVAIATISSTNRVYVSNSLDGTVSVIDGQTNTVIRTIPAGLDPGSITADNATNLIYAVNSNSSAGMVTVVDGSTDTVAYAIPVGAYPTGIALNPQTNKIYVANQLDGTVSVIDGYTRAEINTVSLAFGSAPGAVGVNPVTNEIYAVNGHGRRTISVISGNPTETALSCTPSSILVNSKTVCSLTVTDNSVTGASTPTGLVYFATDSMGSFNSTTCTLKGTGTVVTCAVSYTPSAVGTGLHTIFGTYGGDSNHMSSSGDKTVNVSSASVGGELTSSYELAILVMLALPLTGIIGASCTAVLLLAKIQRRR